MGRPEPVTPARSVSDRKVTVATPPVLVKSTTSLGGNVWSEVSKISTIPPACALKPRPVRVVFNITSRVCSGMVQVTGGAFRVRDTAEDEFAQPRLDLRDTTKNAPPHARGCRQ